MQSRKGMWRSALDAVMVGFVLGGLGLLVVLELVELIK
jgi:hypothetical protein